MKTFKTVCAATLLALSLSIPAYADSTDPGEVHTPGSPAPICTDDGTIITEDTALTDESDISSSLFADMLWAMASIF